MRSERNECDARLQPNFLEISRDSISRAGFVLCVGFVLEISRRIWVIFMFSRTKLETVKFMIQKLEQNLAVLCNEKIHFHFPFRHSEFTIRGVKWKKYLKGNKSDKKQKKMYSLIFHFLFRNVSTLSHEKALESFHFLKGYESFDSLSSAELFSEMKIGKSRKSDVSYANSSHNSSTTFHIKFVKFHKDFSSVRFCVNIHWCSEDPTTSHRYYQNRKKKLNRTIRRKREKKGKSKNR